MLVALALSPGVVVDEARAFRSVLSRLPDSEVIGVGENVGPIAGVRGTEQVDLRYDQVPSPEVVAVPGALGLARQMRSAPLLEWLRAVRDQADWILASSTGSVVLGAAGLLEGLPATTHWLAADLLAAQGAEVSVGRIVIAGRLITCQGAVSAIDVGLELARRTYGEQLATQIAAAIRQPDLPPARRRRRWGHRVAAAGIVPAARPVVPVTVIDLRHDARSPSGR